MNAVQTLMTKAEGGDPQAMCELGLCLIAGRGVEKDEALGLTWIKKAVAEGHLEAMFFLGIYTLQGTPDAEQLQVARKLLETAGDYRHVRAQIELAKSFLSGNFWPADDRHALKWIRRAASVGNDSACALLGLYFADRDFSQDALHWFRQAAKAGNPVAQELLDEHLEKMKSWQIEENFAGHALKILSSTLGRPVTQLEGLAKDLETQADAAAFKTLSIMSDYAYGVPLDPWVATLYLEKAAQASDPEAQWFFAERIRIGYVKGLSETDALEWQQKALAAGFQDPGK